MAITLSTPAAYTRYMAQGFDKANIRKIPTGFSCMFGRSNEENHDSRNNLMVNIDIRRANEITPARIVPRGTMATPMNRVQTVGTQYSSFTHGFPLFEEQGSISKDDLQRRFFNEMDVSSRSERSKLKELAMRIHTEHFKKIALRCEIQACQAVLTGTQDMVQGGGAGNILDFLRDSDNFITVDAEWDTTSDPEADLVAGCEQMRIAGMTSPAFIGMNSVTFKAYRDNAKTLAMVNKDLYAWISFSNAALPPDLAFLTQNGWTFAGISKLSNLQSVPFFIYDDTYMESGTYHKFLPDGTVLMFPKNTRLDRWVGPSDLLEMTPTEERIYQEVLGFPPSMPLSQMGIPAGVPFTVEMFHCHMEKFPKVVHLETQAAVIYAPIDTDSIVVLDGCTTPPSP